MDENASPKSHIYVPNSAEDENEKREVHELPPPPRLQKHFVEKQQSGPKEVSRVYGFQHDCGVTALEAAPVGRQPVVRRLNTKFGLFPNFVQSARWAENLKSTSSMFVPIDERDEECRLLGCGAA
jgi:hypothetical protein